MKKNFLSMLLISFATALLVGCGGGGADSEYGDTSQVDEAEAAFGIDFPDDATVTMFIDGANGMSVAGATGYSLDEAQEHFADEMSAAGARVVRDWGTLNNLRATGQLQDIDYEALGMTAPEEKTTATYMVGGKSWGINLSSDGNMRKFDIQAQK